MSECLKRSRENDLEDRKRVDLFLSTYAVYVVEGATQRFVVQKDQLMKEIEKHPEENVTLIRNPRDVEESDMKFAGL